MYILGKVLSQFGCCEIVTQSQSRICNRSFWKREPQMLYEITIATLELSHWRYQTLYNINMNEYLNDQSSDSFNKTVIFGTCTGV